MAKTEQKIIKIVDGSNTTIELTIEQLGLIAAAAIGIWAEDVDSPGAYQRVQGQYDSSGGFRLLGANGLKYDLIELTYITSGNGVGEIGTVVYSLDSVPVKTLTLTYDSNSKLISVEES